MRELTAQQTRQIIISLTLLIEIREEEEMEIFSRGVEKKKAADNRDGLCLIN